MPAKVHVIHNGIDLTQYRPTGATDALQRYGIDPARPYVLFVGRITRQKGIIHLVDAIPEIDPSLQIVLCAGAPDTPEIGQEMAARVAEVSARREGVIWIREMLPRADMIQLYEHAAVFCCPSVYEPFGIINLEAMACETAVVASRVGGIPEVVVPEETGLLVDLALKPRNFRADRSRRLLVGAGGGDQPPRCGPGPACADGQAGPPAGARPLQLGRDRRDHAQSLPHASMRSVSDARNRLARLARLYGIEHSYRDIWGRRHVTSAASQRALLAVMDVPATSDAEVETSLALAESATLA